MLKYCTMGCRAVGEAWREEGMERKLRPWTVSGIV